MRNFEVDSAVLKWEAALENLQRGQRALASAMQLYRADEAEYPNGLAAAVLRLRSVHERLYDAAMTALHIARIHDEAPQVRYVEYAVPVAPAILEGKWRPHLAARQGAAALPAAVQ